MSRSHLGRQVGNECGYLEYCMCGEFSFMYLGTLLTVLSLLNFCESDREKNRYRNTYPLLHQHIVGQADSCSVSAACIHCKHGIHLSRCKL